MQLSSSRTLPRHGSALSRASAAALSGRAGRPLAWASLAAKWRASAIDVVRPLAQGRQLQRQHVEPVQQVLAERALGHGPLQVAVAGRDQADVDRDRACAADAVDLALLDRAQELGLQARLHLADLVQEQRAATGLLEPPDPPRHGAGERALLVAEQLGFEQMVGDRGAVDRDERALRAPAVAVQKARDHLLAGPALAGDQHAGLGGRDSAGHAPAPRPCAGSAQISSCRSWPAAARMAAISSASGGSGRNSRAPALIAAAACSGVQSIA